MLVNLAKTNEIVFHKPNGRKVLFSSELPSIERVLCAKLLGVWLQADMSMKKHINNIFHVCNQRMHLLTQMKKQDLDQALQSVFYAIILARILYASPAWRGYLNAADIHCLQQLFVKAK